jgi:energy-coupling factor transport system permease protein
VTVLERTSPLVKLGVATVWLVGLVTTTEARPGAILTLMALLVVTLLGRVPGPRLARALVPVVLAAAGIAIANLLFSRSNPDPEAAELLRLGPLRVTAQAALAAAGLFTRVMAIASVGLVFVLTTTPTRLADALVQQARVPERFAYGALAAYQAVPRFLADLTTLRTARRLRGLREWHPWILVGLLVRAIRHADQLALAMDARGFGGGPRTTYRPIAWGPIDVVVGMGGLAILIVALAIQR